MSPRIPWAVLIFGILATVALFTKGGLSNEQPAGAESAGPVGDVAGRRSILDHGYRELAVSFMMKSLYARPLEITDIEKTAGLVAAKLGLGQKELEHDLKSERSYVWLARRLPEDQADAVLRMGIRGIYAVEEARRFYPNRRSSAHAVGFMEEKTGLAGVEFHYDHILQRGLSAIGRGNGENGQLQLTLDLRVQKLLGRELARLLEETGAGSGSGILMDVNTGAIAAMISLPDYDPNYYWEATSSERLNRVVSGNVDLGGFRTLFGMAAAYEKMLGAGDDRMAALKLDLLSERLLQQSDDGGWLGKYGDNVLPVELGPWSEEVLTDSEVAVFFKHLGIYGKSSIDLPESAGRGNLSPGQTTPINLLTAFATLVNGGKGVTPHLGEAVLDPGSGRVTKIDHPVKPGLIKSLTSSKIVDLLIDTHKARGEMVFMESIRPAVPEAESSSGPAEGKFNQPAAFQTLLVGFTSHKNSGYALLLSLEKAVVGGEKMTLMRKMAETVMAGMVRLASADIVQPSPEKMAKNADQIYQEWLKSQDRKKSDSATAVKKTARQEIMPDLNGLSLRKAMRNLQQLDLNVRITGSGRVVAQEPKPGPISGSEECLLTLRAEI